MRIVLHKTTDTRTLASFMFMSGPPWLGSAYHPMGNGYELRVEPLGKNKAIIFTRLLNTKKTANIVVPIVGYFMPVDIEIDESGRPTWNLSDIIGRLLDDFKLSAVRIHVQPAGHRLELTSWEDREIKHNKGARYRREVPTNELPVDVVDGEALWAINTHKDHDGRIVHDVYVWTDLSQRLDAQESLWTELQEVAASAV